MKLLSAACVLLVLLGIAYLVTGIINAESLDRDIEAHNIRWDDCNAAIDAYNETTPIARIWGAHSAQELRERMHKLIRERELLNTKIKGHRSWWGPFS